MPYLGSIMPYLCLKVTNSPYCNNSVEVIKYKIEYKRSSQNPVFGYNFRIWPATL